ncbi:MAG: hypothetical protein DDT19_02945 [Syntrophomonadaceae bacterium]|nr:hypothetical protein [Bacillota bacterium]
MTEQRAISDKDLIALFGEDAIAEGSQSIQLAMLSDEEMKETEGAWFWLALPLARAAIWVAPRISTAFRVVGNTAGKNPHTVLLQNNVHRVQIGVDNFGRHVGFGANASNNARYHIYQNQPWRINPY